MARVNPTDPLESIDVRDRTQLRTQIARVKQKLFNIGEENEDPKVQFKYFRNMAARYGSSFVIARRQSGNLWSWGCSAEEPTQELLDHDAGSGTAVWGQLYIGQSFTPDDVWTIDQIYINYAWVGFGATHCLLTIREDNGGDPGTIVATADLLAIGDSAAPGGEYTFTFPSPPTLTADTKYWAVFQASNSSGNPTGYFFWYYLGSDTLPNGELTYSTDGSSWNPELNGRDLRQMKIIGHIYPQFGLGNTSPTSIPQMIDAGGIEFSRVFATGRAHTIALDTSGAPWTWGDNQYSQLGIEPSVVQEQNIAASTGQTDFRKDSNFCALAQTFTPSSNWVGESVSFYIRRIGNPTGNMWVELRDTTFTTDYRPNNILATSELRDVSTMSTSLTYQQFNFDLCDFEVNSGTVYAIVLRADFPLSSSDYFRASVANNAYSGGVGQVCFGDCTCDETSEWTNIGTNDINFQIIGSSSSEQRNSPSTIIGNLTGFAAAAGWGHSLMIDQNDNFVWAWGLNSSGQLGVGDTTDRCSPVSITLGNGRRFRKIDAGDNFSIALDQRNQAWTWGDNQLGQLGKGTTTGTGYFDGTDYMTVANYDAIGDFGTGEFTIETWIYHFGAWGATEPFEGIIGSGNGVVSPPSPSDNGWRFVTVGANFNFNANGANNYINSVGGTPGGVSIPQDQWTHLAISRVGNTIYGFIDGVLADSNDVTGINFNADACLILGRFYCNANDFHLTDALMDEVRISNGTGRYSSNFTPERFFTNDINTTLLIKFNVFPFIDSSSNGYTITNNGVTQQNVADTIYESSPISASSANNFIEIAAGSQSGYGINTLGTVYSWGDNTYGQLGDGTIDNKVSPVSVAGRHSFIQVTGGGRESQGHACALKPDGSVWCWGRNHHGQLGLCDYTDRSSPESVIGRHSFIDVWAAKDGYNTIAIKLDGSVWVWGKDPFCDGVDYCSPVSVPDFNLITLNILGRGYLEDHSNLLEI